MKKIGLLFSLLFFSQQAFSAQGGGSKEEPLAAMPIVQADSAFTEGGGSKEEMSVETPTESIETADVNSLNMLGWIKKCRSLPTNIRQPQISIKHSAFGENQANAAAIFTVKLDECESLMTQQLQGGSWQGEKYSSGFAPFAQKLDLPEDAQVVFHGDFHGDVHSFMNELDNLHNRGWLNDNFEIIQPNTYMIFLGDYVDRGNHGAEVIYTLLRLKLANPDRVFMARGNHEDLVLQETLGFEDECDTKFGYAAELHKRIARIYDVMPVVLYVGCDNNYLQCCHGGMEPGYNPTELLNSDNNVQLLGELKRSLCSCEEAKGSVNLYADFIPTAPKAAYLGKNNSMVSQYIGFMWHDFNVDIHDESVKNVSGRGLIFSKKATEGLLGQQNLGSKKVMGVFRAHQHATNPQDAMMRGLIESKGVYKLWNEFETNLSPDSRSIADGLVWTFNVAPDTVYGKSCKFTFDAFAILTVKNEYKEWGLQIVNTETVSTEISNQPESSGGESKEVEKIEGGGASANALQGEGASAPVKPGYLNNFTNWVSSFWKKP